MLFPFSYISALPSIHAPPFTVCSSQYPHLSAIRLSAINSAEAERELRAAGRNQLETLLLDIRDKMTHKEYIKASVEKDQLLLTEKCNVVSTSLMLVLTVSTRTTYLGVI